MPGRKKEEEEEVEEEEKKKETEGDIKKKNMTMKVEEKAFIT